MSTLDLEGAVLDHAQLVGGELEQGLDELGRIAPRDLISRGLAAQSDDTARTPLAGSECLLEIAHDAA